MKPDQGPLLAGQVPFSPVDHLIAFIKKAGFEGEFRTLAELLLEGKDTKEEMDLAGGEMKKREFDRFEAFINSDEMKKAVADFLRKGD